MKNPDALTYAPDSLRAAREALDALQAELDVQEKKTNLVRRYEPALSLAKEAKAASEKSLRDTIEAKEQARKDAVLLLDGFAAAIQSYESKLWAARRIRGIKLDPDIATLAESARAAIADAGKDLAAGGYAAAKAKALTVAEQLADGESRISEAARLARGW